MQQNNDASASQSVNQIKSVGKKVKELWYKLFFKKSNNANQDEAVNDNASQQANNESTNTTSYTLNNSPQR